MCQQVINELVTFQAGETESNKRIDTMKSTNDLRNQTFCENILYRNAMTKVLSLFHGNLNILLCVLYRIINKISVKVILAQIDTDLSCININVSKCFTKAQHFETLISGLIQDKSVSF